MDTTPMAVLFGVSSWHDNSGFLSICSTSLIAQPLLKRPQSNKMIYVPTVTSYNLHSMSTVFNDNESHSMCKTSYHQKVMGF